MILKHDLCTQNYTKIEHDNDFKYGVPHYFKVSNVKTDEVLCDIKFQEGPIKERGINGVNNEDLIAMVITRLENFQSTDFKCKENDIAILKLEECLMWLRRRTNKRKVKGIEGTSKL